MSKPTIHQLQVGDEVVIHAHSSKLAKLPVDLLRQIVALLEQAE